MTLFGADQPESYTRKVYLFFRELFSQESPFFLRSDLLDRYEAFCRKECREELAETPFSKLLSTVQEAVAREPWVCMATRKGPGVWSYYRFNAETMSEERVDASPRFSGVFLC